MDDRAREVESLLAKALERASQPGDAARAIDEACRAHPDLADPLRRAVRAMGWLDVAFDEASALRPPEIQPMPERLGEFELRRELGRGAMGVVYEAWQPSLKRSVALKVLPRASRFEPQSLARFEREGEALARLRHPGIVPIHAIGRAEDTSFLAMGFVDGAPLDQVLAAARAFRDRNGGRPSLAALAAHASAATRAPAVVRPSEWIAEIARIGIALAEALHVAHAAGIVHRDVKPGNVLLDREGHAVLTDFGLARLEMQSGLTAERAFAGTPSYASPEQAAGRSSSVDARSDVFSLGVTLHEMLTLEPVFRGESTHELLRAVCEQEPGDPRRVEPAIPRDLAAIVARALEKEPADRFPSAQALAEDLRRFLALEPVRSRPLRAHRRVLRWARREPARAALVATLALGVPALAALGAYQVARQDLVRAGERARSEERIDGLLVQAQLEAQQRRTTAALRLLEEALGLAPEDAEVFGAYARALAASERLAEALAAIDARGNEDHGWLRASCLRAARRADEAQALEATLGEPKDVAAMTSAVFVRLARARPNMDFNDFRGAQTIVQRAILISRRPRPHLMHLVLTVTDFTDDVELARSAVWAFERFWPDALATRYARAHFVSRVEPEKGVQLYGEILHEQPDAHFARHNIANALAKLGRTDDALARLAEVPDADPIAPSARYNAGRIAYDAGKLERAEAEYRQALALDPNHAASAMGLGLILNRRGDQQGEIELLRPHAERNPRIARLQNNLGEAYAHVGKLEEAVACYRKAIAADAAYEYAPFGLARCLVRLGQPEEGLAAAQKAVDANPSASSRWRSFTEFLLETPLGPEGKVDADLALQSARRAVALAGNKGPHARFALCRALAMAGSYRELDVEARKLSADIADAKVPAVAAMRPKLEQMLAECRAKLGQDR